MALALFGWFTAAFALPDSGVGVGEANPFVVSVLPGSPAWRDGIRPGDRILDNQDSASATGWSLVVESPDGQRGTTAAGQEARLRSTLPLTVLGLVFVLVGSMLTLRKVQLGLVLLPIGVALAVSSLFVTGSLRDVLIGTIGAAGVAACAFGLLKPHSANTAGLVAVSVLVAATIVVGVVFVPAIFNAADAVRLPAALVCAALAGWYSVDRSRLSRRLASPDGPNAFDLVYLPGATAIAIGCVLFLNVSPIVAGLGLLLLVILYPGARRTWTRALERFFIGNVRRHAEVRAVEDERSRLAREIHDAPLQELAAVIRSLDERDDSSAETNALRSVVAQLRDVATALRPPVLEDLGLPAAVEDLVDVLAAANPAWEVSGHVDDLTDPGIRPPSEIETAAYRVVQEACANALRHSGGTSMTVSGAVAASTIDLTVSDNGVGLAKAAAAAARRAGHFGLDSMRDRSHAVGAALEIVSAPDGLSVRFTWEAQE